MWMSDFGHPPLQLAALALEVQVVRRSDPDALRHSECSLQHLVEEGLDIAEPVAKSRHRVGYQTFRNEQGGCGRRHRSPRDLTACHHCAEQSYLLCVEGQAKRSHRIKR